MNKIARLLILLLAGILLVLLVGPFLVPVPPLEDTLPVRELADPDSRFLEIQGFAVHYKETGEGSPALVLLHGFASSSYSWREVMAPLAGPRAGVTRRVVAFDRPAFGLTERPLVWQGPNPYSAAGQVELTVELMDRLGIQEAVLVGNSAGGTIAARTALEHPERVRALVLVDPAIYQGGGTTAWVRPLFQTPQADRLGPLFVRRIQDWGLDFARSAWHDPSQITEEVWEGYTRPLQAENWDRGLWESFKSGRAASVADRLGELTLPVLVITGDDDRIVPAEESVRLAGELPNVELVVIERCGHVPHEECPQAFLQAVEGFLDQAGLSASQDAR